MKTAQSTFIFLAATFPLLLPALPAIGMSFCCVHLAIRCRKHLNVA